MTNYKEILDDIINFGSDIRSTDIHFSTGIKLHFRLDGILYAIDEIIGSSVLIKKYNMLSKPLEDSFVENLIRALLRENVQKYSTFCSLRSYDESYETAYNRLRANMYFQRDSKAMAIRILPKEIPIIDNLFAFLPEKIKELKEVSSLPHGIVLITGSTGSGKSTTLAAVIDYINKSFRKHVIMLEDPIEYLHVPLSAIITQRELGSDVRSFSEGLCAALREDPDIILVGEMRDKETIQTALEAARTGHLVFSTLHTNRALDTIMRIINVFPEEKQNEIRLDLSETLRYVMTQRLMRKKGGGRTVAVETLRVNDKISYLIKDKKYNKILDEPEYEPLEKSMAKLVEANIVEPAETQKHVTDQNMLNSFLKGGGKF